MTGGMGGRISNLLAASLRRGGAPPPLIPDVEERLV